MKMRNKVRSPQNCCSCGARLDTSVLFRVDQGGRTYCCRCYLRHNRRGEVNRPGQPTPNTLYVMTPLGAMSRGYSMVAPALGNVAPFTPLQVADAPAGVIASSSPAPAESAPGSVPPALTSIDVALAHEDVAVNVAAVLADFFPDLPTALQDAEPEEAGFVGSTSTVPLPVLSIVPDSVDAVSEDAVSDNMPEDIHEAGTARPAAPRPNPPSGSPHLARLRCALACAHAGRRAYEYTRRGDDRLRPALALVSEAASGARRPSGESILISRLVVAIEILRQTAPGAGEEMEPAIAAVIETAETAIAVIKREPWRTVDYAARHAYMHAAEAVRRAHAAAGPGEDEQALIEALGGQDELAFGQASYLWSSVSPDDTFQEAGMASVAKQAPRMLSRAPRMLAERAVAAL